MYKEYYRFSEDPFDLRPDPRFLYLARSHSEVLSAMKSGIKEKKGIIVIAGQTGIGKTTLINALLEDLGEEMKTAYISSPIPDFKSLLETILQELGVPINEGENEIYLLLIQFRKYFNERYSRGEIVRVIIDEAQSLNAEVLESLGRLLDPDTAAAKSLQILLVGDMELLWMLNSEKLEAVNREIEVYAQIKPLTREEGRGYIQHRLKVAGRDISEIFKAGAVKKIWKHAKGIPRAMNLLCDRALFIGHEKSRPIIDSKIVRQAIADLDHHEDAGTEAGAFANLGRSARFGAIRFAIFILSLGIFFLALGEIRQVIMQ